MIGDPALFIQRLNVNTTDPEKGLEKLVASIVPCEGYDIHTQNGAEHGKRHPPIILPEEDPIVASVFGDFAYNSMSMREIMNCVLDMYYSQRKVRCEDIRNSGKQLSKKELRKEMMIRKNGLPFEIHHVGTAEFAATHLGGFPFDEKSRSLIVSAMLHDVIEDIPYSLDWVFHHIGNLDSKFGKEVTDRVVTLTNFYKHIMREVDRRAQDCKGSSDVRLIAESLRRAYSDIEESLGNDFLYIKNEVRSLDHLAEGIYEHPKVVEREREITAYERVKSYLVRRSFPDYARKIVEHDQKTGDSASFLKLCDILHNSSTAFDTETDDRMKLIKKNISYIDALSSILHRGNLGYDWALQRAVGITLDLAVEQMDKCILSADPTQGAQKELRGYIARLSDYALLLLKPFKVNPFEIRERYGLGIYYKAPCPK